MSFDGGSHQSTSSCGLVTLEAPEGDIFEVESILDVRDVEVCQSYVIYEHSFAQNHLCLFCDLCFKNVALYLLPSKSVLMKLETYSKPIVDSA